MSGGPDDEGHKTMGSPNWALLPPARPRNLQIGFERTVGKEQELITWFTTVFMVLHY